MGQPGPRGLVGLLEVGHERAMSHAWLKPAVDLGGQAGLAHAGRASSGGRTEMALPSESRWIGQAPPSRRAAADDPPCLDRERQEAGGSWRFWLFGGVRAERPDGTTLRLGGKPRRLLGLLLLAADEVVEADVLVDHLWGGRLPSDPRNSLHEVVSRLRRALEDRHQDLVVTVGQDYRVRTDRDSVDVTVFQRLVAAGLALADVDPATARVLLEAGLIRARGTLPDLHPDGWLSEEVNRLHRLRARASAVLGELEAGGVLRLADGYAACGLARSPAAQVFTVAVTVDDLALAQFADVVNAVTAAGGRPHRLSEDALAALVTGARKAVSAAAQAVEAVRPAAPGAPGAGIELGPASDDRILEQATRLARRAAPGEILLSASVRHLAEAGGSTAVFEEVGDDLWRVGRGSPPSEPSTAESPFVGRVRDLAAVAELLSLEQVVTIRGPGGIGKSRLAREVAATLEPRYQDGVVAIDLATAELSGGAVAVTMRELGFVSQPSRPLQRTLVDRLATRKLLLLLDNCECCATDVRRLVAELVERCPGVKVLTTSRVALGVAGPTHGLEGLEPDDALCLLQSLTGTRQGPAPRPGDGASRGLLAMLEGMPLAIECAASLVRAENVEATVSTLARLPDGAVLPALDAARAGRGRYRSVELSLQASHGSLAPADARFFERLSSLRGTFDVHDALAAATGSSVSLVADQLVGLHGASLLRLEDSGRWRMLEPVRQFAATLLLRRGEQVDQADRHARHFADFAQRAESQLRGPAEGAWFTRLSGASANLDSALAWCVEDGDAATALRLTSSLWWFWAARGMFVEGVTALDQALALPGEVAATLRAKALVAAGHLSWWAGNPRRTGELALSALDLMRGAQPDEASVVWLAGWARMSLAAATMWGGGNRAEGAALCDEAAELLRSIGDHTGFGIACEVGGGIAWHDGDDARYRDLARRALDAFEVGGHQTMIAQGRRVLGLAEALGGELDGGRALVAAGLRLSEQLGDLGGKPLGLCFLGLVESVGGRPGEALDAFVSSIECNIEQGQVWPAVIAVSFAGERAALGERPHDATRLLAAAGELTRSTGIGLAPRERRKAVEAAALAASQMGEGEFQAARADGAGLDVVQTLRLALDILGHGDASCGGPTPGLTDLSSGCAVLDG